MTVSHWNTGASAVRFRNQQKEKMKKDWKVTLSYDVKHEDTYLIQNETKEDAIYIAENQNMSSKYNCKCIDEESEIYDVEDSEETTIKEVVWNSEKKDWLVKDER